MKFMSEFYSIIYLTAIAFLNSIDNIGIGVAYSIAGKKVPLSKNILLSSMAFLVSYICAVSGKAMSSFLNEKTCSVISVSLLVFMGLRMIYEAFRKKDDNLDKSNIISNKEAITVGIALSLDDVGSSISSGLIGYGPFMISIPYFIISFIIFYLANFSTKFTSKLNIDNKATIISGILMIALGLTQLLNQ